MKRKNTEVSAAEEPAVQKQPGKFRRAMMKFGKRNAIIAASVLLIGAAVLLNWVLFANGNQKKNGYQGYDQPSGNIAENDKNNQPVSVDSTDAYFSATQVSRQRARDEALEVLQSVVENVDAGEQTKNEALAGITCIADEIRKEADMETLITAKGFEQCVAVLNGDSVNIIVKAESLQPAQIAQINEIVYASTGITPDGVTIINK
ncbi:MAG: SpoIIIAH-like family protein [Clostridia bacterium]|nr:SpoIIIAH-like family protein [Clostridia bacterium]